MDVNRTADYTYDREKMKDAIDLVVITDSEAILGIGGESEDSNTITPYNCKLYKTASYTIYNDP